LNRIDETIMFRPLSKNDIVAIVELHYKELQKKLAESNIKLSATPEAISKLCEMGYDPQFGARPVKRVIQKMLLNELSKQILAGKIAKGYTYVMDIFDDPENKTAQVKFVFRKPIKEDKQLLE
jgi:ATP-dependent Clp protease ATP-binding subunit ClpB